MGTVKNFRTYFPLPFKIVIHFVVSLVIGMTVCIWMVGEQTLLKYASAGRPSLVVYSGSDFVEPDAGRKSTGIICFGDSNFLYPPDVMRNEENVDAYMGETIRQAVMKETGRNDVKTLDWSFAGADMFHYYCMFFKARKRTPDLIIIPLNWRTLGSEWLTTTTDYHRELSGLAPFRGRLTPGSADPFRLKGITLSEQLQHKSFYWLFYPSGFKSWVLDIARPLSKVDNKRENILQEPGMDKTAAREGKRGNFKQQLERLKENYPMNITSSNPQLVGLSALTAIASEYGAKVLVFIWPVDRKHLAKARIFDEAPFAESKQLILQKTEKENIFFMDLSDLLDHQFFYDGMGHCTLEGRQKIAGVLAPEIARILYGERNGPSHSTEM